MADLGGFTESDANEQIQKICDEMKCRVQERTGKTYEEFRAVRYKSQIVQGVNLIIKVHVGGCSYLHLKVFQSLPSDGGETILHGVQEDHCKDDPIVPF